MHCMAHGRTIDTRPSRGSRNAAAVEKLSKHDATRNHSTNNNKAARDFAVPDLEQFEHPKPTKSSSSPRNSHRPQRNYQTNGSNGRREGTEDLYYNGDGDRESVGSCPTPPDYVDAAQPQLQRSPRLSPRRGSPRRVTTSSGRDYSRDYNWEPPTQSSTRRSPRRRSPLPRCSDSFPATELIANFDSRISGEGCRVSGRSSPGGKRSSVTNLDPNGVAGSLTGAKHESNPNMKSYTGDSAKSCGDGSSKPQKAEVEDEEGDGGGCGSSVNLEVPLSVDVPYPAKWRCFGRRPPAILEYRPMGEPRTRNVRPAGKQSYLVRRADEKRGCDGQVYEGDIWDDNYGLSKPITEKWSTPLPYGETRVIRTGDVDPWFTPSRGDLIIINPAQNYYRAMKSGYVMSLRGRYMFGIGDIVLRLGKFLPNGTYVPYGNLELYMYTPSKEWIFLGRQPYLLVDFNYHNLDYESPGNYLAVGTFLTESFKPRRGDVIIRGCTWSENSPAMHRRYNSSVKYWRPNMEFLPNDMLLRPYVDLGRCEKTKEFYWGAAELYSYSGKGLAWAYWGRDHHICDTPFPGGDNEPIKTGHHKHETGYYGSDNFENRGA
ncbi:hypothetical protein R1flu_010868 [Riccia fluitans]|uniref:Uncharacterized protein n=1 Tax=Riccia fluitans TaxID=41844 RepID=A0ABD1Z676_9MARC